jgi:ribosomal protein L37E
MEETFICTACGYMGEPKKVVKGSFLLELFLWLLFLLPGLAYSVWRLATKHKACAKCGSPNVVPTNSPIGAELVKKYHPDAQ